MKNLLYWGIKQYIKIALFCYYSAYRMKGMHYLAENKPTMMLANHQNALLDALLIAASSKKPPYFLTRSDVFRNRLIRSIFKLLRMLPVYRIRDGRENLSKNQVVFDTCAALLNQKETILLFPEANHNLKRVVRPLSKGFTRILFTTLERYPDLDIELIPIGVNYQNAASFPDRASFYFGKPLALKQLYSAKDERTAALEISARIAQEIKTLTTHIPPELPYEATLEHLEASGADFLDPKACNRLIASPGNKTTANSLSGSKKPHFVRKFIFELINFPVLLIWRLMIKKRVSEAEFISTFRFLFSCVVYPVFYGLIFTICALNFTPVLATLLIALHFSINLWYVKLS